VYQLIKHSRLTVLTTIFNFGWISKIMLKIEIDYIINLHFYYHIFNIFNYNNRLKTTDKVIYNHNKKKFLFLGHKFQFSLSINLIC